MYKCIKETRGISVKFSLECDVDSNILLRKEIKAVDGTKEFILIPNQQGILSKIKLIAKVPNPQQFFSKIEPGTGEAKLNITINRDSKLYEEIISDIQELESILSFSADLKRIFWEMPKEECIAENEEEREKLKVFGMQFLKRYADNPVLLEEYTFQRMIDSRKNYSSLSILKAFFREGKNEFKSFRYIYAFYNFYFIIEDIYGGGKTKEKDVLQNFKQSTELLGLVELTMKNYIETDRRHLTNIERLLQEEKLSYTTEGMIELIWKVRGNLHHYISKSSKRLGTPFNHRDFEPVSFFVMSLALHAILYRIVEINKKLSGAVT
jgi:hypothetical protein